LLTHISVAPLADRLSVTMAAERYGARPWLATAPRGGAVGGGGKKSAPSVHPGAPSRGTSFGEPTPRPRLRSA